MVAPVKELITEREKEVSQMKHVAFVKLTGLGEKVYNKACELIAGIEDPRIEDETFWSAVNYWYEFFLLTNLYGLKKNV